MIMHAEQQYGILYPTKTYLSKSTACSKYQFFHENMDYPSTYLYLLTYLLTYLLKSVL